MWLPEQWKSDDDSDSAVSQEDAAASHSDYDSRKMEATTQADDEEAVATMMEQYEPIDDTQAMPPLEPVQDMLDRRDREEGQHQQHRQQALEQLQSDAAGQGEQEQQGPLHLDTSSHSRDDVGEQGDEEAKTDESISAQGDARRTRSGRVFARTAQATEQQRQVKWAIDRITELATYKRAQAHMAAAARAATSQDMWPVPDRFDQAMHPHNPERQKWEQAMLKP